MRLVSIQTNFSSGEIDPLLRARVDLKQYQNGAETLTNVLVQPQGGVRRRGGLKKVYELPSGAAPESGTRSVPFEFNVNDSYMLIFTNQRMYVFKDKVLITNINGTGNSYLSISPVTSSILSTMCWTQSADTLIVTHKDINPIKIVRGATDASWTVEYIDFTGIPKYAYTLGVYKPTGTMTPSSDAGNITLTASQTAVTGTAQTGSTSTTIKLAAAASATIDFYKGMTVEITGGTGVGQYAIITAYNGTTKVATVDSIWSTTPSNTSTYSIQIFHESSVGQYVNSTVQGRAKIVKFTSATVVEAYTEVPFFNTSAIASGSWELEAGYEDVWSDARGWPRTCTFHEGRLYMGGSGSRPSTMWGSKVGLFFDFEPDQAYDDDAVEATLDTNSLNVITDIISGRDLQVFTTGGEFYVPQSGLDPITPANFFVKTVSRNGSREGIRVQILQSGTLYVQRQGKALNEFQFSDTTLSYISTSISLLSSHLINAPQELALRKATSTEESDTLFMLNGNGTMAVYSILRQQEVVAPSRFTTDGEFKDIGVDIEDIYTVVKRTFNSVDKYFVEVIDTSTFTDCCYTGGAASGASSLPHIGKTLNVICDGSVLSDEVVSGGGAITFDRPSTSSYEVGLPFTVTIKTLPAEPRLAAGVRIGFVKRIIEVNALLYQTQHMIINGNLVPMRTLDTVDILDNAMPSFTGTKNVGGILGYDQDAQITITQELPLKMTLLGLEYRLSIYGGT